jgi:transcriptional regulator with XRE-family HTH domain
MVNEVLHACSNYEIMGGSTGDHPMDRDQARRLGALIRQYREAQGLSLRDLEDQTGIDDGLLTRMEGGVILTPAPDKLGRIAEALDIPLADLYGLADYAVPSELPTLKPYLRTKYRRLPSAAADQLEAYAERLAKRHGVDLSGPAPGEDERPGPVTTKRNKKGGPRHVKDNRTKH